MVEWNVLVATFYFAAAIVADALLAQDVRPGLEDAPSSLRASGMMLLLCVAAPPIMSERKDWNVVIDGTVQYVLLCLLLFGVAMVGLHEGGPGTRAADGIFVAVLFIPSVSLILRGGTDVKDMEANNVLENKARVASTSLAASALFYGSARALRVGLLHAYSTRTFEVSSGSNSTSFVTLGYGLSSLPLTVVSSFGAAIGIGAALVVIESRWREEKHTASDYSTLMGICGTITLTAAFCVLMAMHEQIDTLPALYGAGACDTTFEDCRAAFLARRFAFCNTPFPQMLLTSLGMFVFAFPESKKLDRPFFQWSWEILLISCACGAVAALWWGTTMTFDEEKYEEWMGVIMIAGAVIAVLFRTDVGVFVYLVGFVIAETLEIYTWGFAEIAQYASHVMLWVQGVFLVLHLLLSFLQDACVRSDALKVVLGSIAICGTSVSVLLCVSALCLFASVSGGGLMALGSQGGDGVRVVFTFFYEHFVPVFVWGGVYSCRCEVPAFDEIVGRSSRQLLWLLMLPLVIIVNAQVQHSIWESVVQDYSMYIDDWPFVASVFGIGLLPWATSSLV